MRDTYTIKSFPVMFWMSERESEIVREFNKSGFKIAIRPWEISEGIKLLLDDTSEISLLKYTLDVGSYDVIFPESYPDIKKVKFLFDCNDDEYVAFELSDIAEINTTVPHTNIYRKPCIKRG